MVKRVSDVWSLTLGLLCTLPYVGELCLHIHTHLDIKIEPSHTGGSALCSFKLFGRQISNHPSSSASLRDQLVLPHLCSWGLSSPLTCSWSSFVPFSFLFFLFWFQVWICCCVRSFPALLRVKTPDSSLLRPCAWGPGQEPPPGKSHVICLCVD